MILLAFLIALHSSISHEILHGHPTKNDFVNSIFVFPAVGIFIPFLRFKDTHLEHHKNENLTDPYDDPETNFIDPKKWETDNSGIKNDGSDSEADYQEPIAVTEFNKFT